MKALTLKPAHFGPYTLGGLIAKWAHSDDEVLRKAAQQLAHTATPLEERIVANFRRIRRTEFDRHIFGCGVREEAQIRQAIRDELERLW